MEKSKFIELVAEHILEYMPESNTEATAEVMERAKHNDTKLHGLILRNRSVCSGNYRFYKFIAVHIFLLRQMQQKERQKTFSKIVRSVRNHKEPPIL